MKRAAQHVSGRPPAPELGDAPILKSKTNKYAHADMSIKQPITTNTIE